MTGGESAKAAAIAMAKAEAAKAKAEAAAAVQSKEWIGQINLIYVGLMGVGLIMVQAFLTADELGLAGTVCVMAFSIAIPLLAALTMVNQMEAARGRLSGSVLVEIARVVAQLSASVGVVAGFWHITPMAGIAVIVSGLVGIGVHSAGYVKLDRAAKAEASGVSGDAG